MATSSETVVHKFPSRTHNQRIRLRDTVVSNRSIFPCLGLGQQNMKALRRTICNMRVPIDAPKMSPRCPQNVPKMSPRCLQDVPNIPRCPQDFPKMSPAFQDVPRMSPSSPLTLDVPQVDPTRFRPQNIFFNILRAWK